MVYRLVFVAAVLCLCLTDAMPLQKRTGNVRGKPPTIIIIQALNRPKKPPTAAPVTTTAAPIKAANGRLASDSYHRFLLSEALDLPMGMQANGYLDNFLSMIYGPPAAPKKAGPTPSPSVRHRSMMASHLAEALDLPIPYHHSRRPMFF